MHREVEWVEPAGAFAAEGELLELGRAPRAPSRLRPRISQAFRLPRPGPLALAPAVLLAALTFGPVSAGTRAAPRPPTFMAPAWSCQAVVVHVNPASPALHGRLPLTRYVLRNCAAAPHP